MSWSADKMEPSFREIGIYYNRYPALYKGNMLVVALWFYTFSFEW